MTALKKLIVYYKAKCDGWDPSRHNFETVKGNTDNVSNKIVSSVS